MIGIEVFQLNSVNPFNTLNMIPHTPWLERKFNFDFPVTHFPFIALRLQGCLPRIEGLIKGLSEKQTEEQINGWSVKEHIGHLIDLEELHKGRIDDFLSGAAVLRAADMSNQKTREANHNNTSLIKLLDAFLQTRTEFTERLEAFDETQLSLSAIHPRLQKPMRMVDMAYFVAEHDDHHLVLMTKLIEQVKS